MSFEANPPKQMACDKLEQQSQYESDLDPGMSKLLQMLFSHSNRGSTISAALKAVESTPPPIASGAEAVLAKPALLAEPAAREQQEHAQQVAPAKPRANSFATAIAAADGPALFQPSLAQPAQKQQKSKEPSPENICDKPATESERLPQVP